MPLSISMPNRFLCDALDEMRECYKTYNFSVIMSLIEECQTLGNRMEAALQDQHDTRNLASEIRELKKEKRQLREAIEDSRDELEKIQSKSKGKKRDQCIPDQGQGPHPGDRSTEEHPKPDALVQP